MWARITRADVLSPQGIEESLRIARETVLPTLQDEEGFRGLVILADQDAANVNLVGIVFWDSRKSLRLSREKEREMRMKGFEAGRAELTGPPVEVGIYEVVVDNIGLE